MDQLLEEDDVPIAQHQELDISSNLPERSAVKEDFDSLRNRPAQPPGAHIIHCRNQEGQTLQFNRSIPDSDILDKGGLRLRLTSFYDWPKPIQPIAKYFAQNGIFYTGNGDKVTCYYCMTWMRASELWEDPDIRSRVCLQECPYTANLNAV